MIKRRKAEAETAGRLGRFFDILDAGGIDGAVLDNRDDIFYFSGYTGSDSIVVLSTKKRQGWLATDSRYIEEAGKTAAGLEIVLWRNHFPQFVGKMIAKRRMRRMVYTPRTLTVAFFNALSMEAGGVERWLDCGQDIAGLRSIKSPSEVAAVEKALACAEAAFLASKNRWKAGMTEAEVKNDLEWEMRRRGAEDAAFETIVAAGANASLPHAHAGDGKICGGKMLLIDFGARVDRYNSDLTRTLWAGGAPAVWVKRYRRVLAAQRAGIEAIAAGVPCRAPDAAARKVFARAGIGDRFTHSLGHGVGLAVHEDPRLHLKSKLALAAGNIVTVEPGVYFHGSGGIRVEDMVLVEEGGARALSSLPKDVDSMVF